MADCAYVMAHATDKAQTILTNWIRPSPGEASSPQRPSARPTHESRRIPLARALSRRRRRTEKRRRLLAAGDKPLLTGRRSSLYPLSHTLKSHRLHPRRRARSHIWAPLPASRQRRISAGRQARERESATNVRPPQDLHARDAIPSVVSSFPRH